MIVHTKRSREEDYGLRLRIIWALFLWAFIFYGVGNSLLSSNQALLGLLLILINSVWVCAIGVLFRPIIARDKPSIANIYFISRVGEALFLGLGAIMVVVAPQDVWTAWNAILYPLGMIILGIGSIAFCYWLISTKCIHKLLAWLWLIGYICLIFGMLLTLLEFDSQAMYFLLPGAVFEISFAVLLLFLGQRSIHPKH